MASWIGPWEIMFNFWLIVPFVFYLLTLHRALEKCSPQTRAMTPGLVWLELIPLFGLVWQFIVAISLGKSLGNEYRARGLEAPSRPTQSLGLAMAAAYTASALCIVFLWGSLLSGFGGEDVPYDVTPLLAPLGGVAGALGLAGFVLWIVYWVKVHQYSSRLTRPQQWSGSYPGGPNPYGSFCSSCGQFVPGTRYCSHCGRDQHPARYSALPAGRDSGPV
jgi:hypothetical protein